MVWLKLFRTQSFEQGKQLSRTSLGLLKKPLFTGSDNLKLRYVFRITNLQHYFKKRDIVNNPYNPYHKVPKSLFTKEYKKLMSLAKYRNSLALAIDKAEKYRLDSYTKKKQKGIDRIIQDSFIYLAGKNIQIAITKRKTDEEIEEAIAYAKPVKRKKNVSAIRTGIRPSNSRMAMNIAKHFKDLEYYTSETNQEQEKTDSKSKISKKELIMSVKEYKNKRKEELMSDPILESKMNANALNKNLENASVNKLKN